MLFQKRGSFALRAALGATLASVGLAVSLAATAATPSGADAAVAKAVEQLRVAMVAGDEATLKKLTEPQLSYGHSSAHI